MPQLLAASGTVIELERGRPELWMRTCFAPHKWEDMSLWPPNEKWMKDGLIEELQPGELGFWIGPPKIALREKKKDEMMETRKRRFTHLPRRSG